MGYVWKTLCLAPPTSFLPREDSVLYLLPSMSVCRLQKQPPPFPFLPPPIERRRTQLERSSLPPLRSVSLLTQWGRVPGDAATAEAVPADGSKSADLIARPRSLYETVGHPGWICNLVTAPEKIFSAQSCTDCNWEQTFSGTYCPMQFLEEWHVCNSKHSSFQQAHGSICVCSAARDIEPH